MPKDRFSSLDCRKICTELNESLSEYRLANFYDINKKTYLLKFAKTDSKRYIVIESGVRLHETTYVRDKNDVPSVFSMKVRRSLGTKKLDSVRQLGMDRVIILTFSSLKETFHLIVELYAGGNVILTDSEYTILTLIRRYTVKDIEVNVGCTYPLHFSRDLQELQVADFEKFFKTPKGTLNKHLGSRLQFGGPEVNHCILNAGLTPDMLASDVSPEFYPILHEKFNELVDFAKEEGGCKGWIIADAKKSSTGEEFLQYNFFIPILFSQFAEAENILEFDTYSLCVDEFYSRLEDQKILLQIMKKETLVEKTLDMVRADHEKRISKYDAEIERVNKCAELILQHVDLVDNTINRLRVSVASKMNWDTLKELIKQEKARGDPSASIIHKLNLLEDKFTILLYDKYVDDYEDDDEVTATVQEIEITLSLSAYSNATAHYDEKRKLNDKKQKTIEVADIALQSAEKKARRQMKDIKTKSKITSVRNRYWFEKFNWFISSDNYLVIGGRDLQQNDIIYRRYLQKNDLYFHANIIGAASVVLKNPSGEPVPSRTLEEAGSFALCYSNAWKNKVVTSCYWVNDNQVSKTAPSGEYIAAGAFMIRGKKNVLKHGVLAMGFGIMFKLADESLANHENDRLANDNDDYVPSDLSEEDPNDIMQSDSDNDDDNNDNDQENEGDINLDESTSESDDMEMFSVPLVRDENEIVVDVDTEITDVTDETTGKTNTNEQSQGKKKKGPKPIEYKRGQKTRAKKREKYDWQTEEERKIAMEYLQGKQEDSQEDVKDDESKTAKDMTWQEKLALNVEIARRKYDAEAEEEEIRNLVKQEKIELLSEEDIAKLKELEAKGLGINLSSFTGSPVEGDILMYAIPVCAPYETMKNFKYKVKVLPGNVKKGKSLNAAKTIFLRNQAITDHEKELIREIPESDLSISLITNSKISAPGINKLIYKKKKK